MAARQVNIPPGGAYEESWCSILREVAELTELNCVWTIRDFSNYKLNDKIESSVFSSGDDDEWKWHLTVDLEKSVRHGQGFSITRSEYLEAGFRLGPCGESEVEKKMQPIRLQLSILNSNGEKTNTHTQTVTPSCFRNRRHVNWETFIKRTDLESTANGLLSQDKLALFGEIILVGDKINTTDPRNIIGFKSIKQSTDLGKSFDTGRFSDVALAVGSQEFPAHKFILVARSPVFAAMFEHEMEEQKLNRVTITDFEPEVINEMLRFIYTGKVSALEKKMAHDLLAASDKYDLEDLKVVCEDFLSRNLSVESLAKTLFAADLHRADKLKARTLIFFKTRAAAVIETEGWKNLMRPYPHFLAEAFSTLAIHRNYE